MFCCVFPEETAGTNREKRRQCAKQKWRIIFLHISVLREWDGEVRREQWVAVTIPKGTGWPPFNQGNYAQPLPGNSDTYTHTLFPWAFIPISINPSLPHIFWFPLPHLLTHGFSFPLAPFLLFLWMLMRSSSCTSHWVSSCVGIAGEQVHSFAC